MPLLSICVPTYNRRELLGKLIGSVVAELPGMEVEIVIVDDGSDDGTRDMVRQWRVTLGGRLRYVWQPNAGRASALKRSILESAGEFVIPMDSDDHFLAGWLDTVKEGIDMLRAAPAIGGRPVHSLIFKVSHSGSTHSAMEPLRTNLLAFRADHGAKGDMKEVAEARAIKACMYDVPAGCRRVPTSLLWARLAQLGDSLFVDREIVWKDYLPGGMTDSIRRLKVQNPYPLMALNEVIAGSRVYRSRIFRIKAMVQWARYALHSRIGSYDKMWKVASLPVGAVLYVFDRLFRAAR